MAQASKVLGEGLLPQDCFLCGTLTSRALLCDDCANDLPSLPEMACPVCALPSPDRATCGACLKQAPYFDATHAPLRYAFPVDRLVQVLKYQHRLVVAGFFAEQMLRASQYHAPGDLFMALPLSQVRLQERGFNQAIEIARPLARQLGKPLAIQGYARTLDTVPQTTLPWKERQKNIRGAFECTLDLSGKQIIVIDDVMTTGATLNEFARTLKKHGASRVTNWVVARALRN